VIGYAVQLKNSLALSIPIRWSFAYAASRTPSSV
jgi:hypothetical protein